MAPPAWRQARVVSRLAEHGAPTWRVSLANTLFGEVDGRHRYDTSRRVSDELGLHREKYERMPLQAVLDWMRLQSRAPWMAAWSMCS